MQTLQPADWPRPRGFSNGLVVDTPGRWVVLAGQTGPDAEGEYPEDFAAQTRNSLTKIVRLLQEAGGGPEHIVRLNWYITTPDEYENGGQALGDAWKDTIGRNFPTSTLLYISGLADRRAKVEIEVTAFIPA